MTTDIKGRKICLSCYEQYLEEDNYCGNDGSRLVTIDFDSISTEPRPVSDSRASGVAEKS
jgi:hypothetical protein